MKLRDGGTYEFNGALFHCYRFAYDKNSGEEFFGLSEYDPEADHGVGNVELLVIPDGCLFYSRPDEAGSIGWSGGLAEPGDDSGFTIDDLEFVGMFREEKKREERR